MVGKIVKSHTTVAKYVTNFASKKREELSKNLKKSIENGVRFSLTADEVTLLNCKRYLNITLKTPTEKINLGLKRMEGPHPAEKIIECLTDMLAIFGLNMTQDIVSVTFDGASFLKDYFEKQY